MSKGILASFPFTFLHISQNSHLHLQTWNKSCVYLAVNGKSLCELEQFTVFNYGIQLET